MESGRYQMWIDHLRAWARAKPSVVGLVGAGSTGGRNRPPDRFSDHDVLVVSKDGAGEQLRADLSWLPESDRIILVHAETLHGRGVIYDDGHLVEVAVIDQRELNVIKLNDYAVLVDKGGVAARLAQIADRTATESATDDSSGVRRFGHFVQEIVVGANRYARGELISANERIRGRATTLLVSLIGSVSSCGNSTLDNLDPHRRFEEAQPEIAARLTTALESPLPTTARVLVEMSEEELAGRSEVADPQVFATLARLLDCTMPIVDPPPVM